MSLEGVTVSSGQFWASAAVTGALDIVLVALLTWRIDNSRFRSLRWTLALTAAIFWAVFGIVLVQVFWDWYYRYIYPGWLRGAALLLFIPLFFGGLALLFHWLALRLPGNPILTFCLLGGTESVLEHLWGIYVLRIFDVPMLQAASPVSVLAFAFPEYVFYWCIVIGIAALAQSSWQRVSRSSRPAFP